MRPYECPFTKDNKCHGDCIFYNGCFDSNDPENCNLMSAIRNINSLELPDNQIDIRLVEIRNAIEAKDSSDDSYKLEEIKDLLNEIKEKL